MTKTSAAILAFLLGVSGAGQASDSAVALRETFDANSPHARCDTRRERLNKLHQGTVRQHSICLAKDGEKQTSSKRTTSGVCSRTECEALHQEMVRLQSKQEQIGKQCDRIASNIEKSRAHLQKVTSQSRRDSQSSVDAMLESRKDTVWLAALASRLAYGDGDAYRTSRYLNKVDEAIDPVSGFAGRAFLTPDGSTLMIAYRGTEPSDKGDLRADGGLFLADKLPGSVADRHVSATLAKQVASAEAFTERVLKKYQQSGRKTVVTGHSLGGFLAQVESARSGVEAHTYNAPSALSYIKQQKPGQPITSLQFHHVRPNDRVRKSTGQHHGVVVRYPERGFDAVVISDGRRNSGYTSVFGSTTENILNGRFDEAVLKVEEHSIDAFYVDLFGGMRGKAE